LAFQFSQKNNISHSFDAAKQERTSCTASWNDTLIFS
jgi:hypothetical protein